MRSFKIMTFGCQMNEHDTEKMSGVLRAEGLTPSESLENADLILLNTCSIREKAEQKFFSELGKLRELKKERPHLVIGVSGCIAQQEGKKILRRAPYVNFIFGNQNISGLPALLKGARDGVCGTSVEFSEGYEHGVFPAERESSISSFVNIMFGCDNFCSYCVVPYVRGREKSRRPEDIVSEIEALVADGCREVTLLGQNVNSYGAGLDGGYTFTDLLEKVNAIDSLLRIRFVTSHPKDLSDRLVDAMANLPKVCESIHLPIQSASDSVLKAMNRKYTLDDYMTRLNKLRAAMPDIWLSTDIIVGFPGETDDDYEKTYKLLEDIRYDNIFSFKYSRRPNTAALKLSGHIPEDIKAERLDRVINLQNLISEEKNRSRVGIVEEVLVEGPDKSEQGGRLTGRSRGGRIVNFDGDLSLIGTLVKVRVTEGKKHSLMGELVADEVYR
ncbi:MAG TPA: tRNA (N6-isopentenyl adenosine(37)-C2)-methylthiotransferase MiaB [Nitrospirota bacterium]